MSATRAVSAIGSAIGSGRKRGDPRAVSGLGDEVDETSLKEVGGAASDLDGRVGPGTKGTRRHEVDELVLTGSP